MNIKEAEALEMLTALFDTYWETAPVFPIPEEHERHKIAAKSVFLAGFIAAFRQQRI
jgi:hypothetical protein